MTFHVWVQLSLVLLALGGIAGAHKLTIKTDADKNSQSTNTMTVEIFSDLCKKVRATVTVKGLATAGTEYNRDFEGPNFGDPSRIRLTISGDDGLKLDWIDVYNSYTGRTYHFPCPDGGCQLSTDPTDWDNAVPKLDLDVEGRHRLRLKTDAEKNSQTSGDLTVEIFSDFCDDASVTTIVNGLTEPGTDYGRDFEGPNFGDPKRIRLTISGDDWLKLDRVEVYNSFTGRFYNFPCPAHGCQLSTDPKDGDDHPVKQLDLDVEARAKPGRNEL